MLQNNPTISMNDVIRCKVSDLFLTVTYKDGAALDVSPLLSSTDQFIADAPTRTIGVDFINLYQSIIQYIASHLIRIEYYIEDNTFQRQISIISMIGGIIGGNNVRTARPGQGNRPTAPKGNFFRELRVYPASFAFRQDIQKGDKILLPSSALNELHFMISSRNKDPMIFCLKNGSKMTYCGVLEFVAEEGLCYIPNWMFKMLKFPEPGTPATVALVTDMKKRDGNVRHMIKLQPHQTKFINMENPKAILQYQLRNFTCLHEGDTISIQVFNEKFQIDILQISPKNEYNAICIIDADVNVDFAPPLDYVEPERVPRPEIHTEQAKKGGIFGGSGVRIDEKFKGSQKKVVQTVPSEQEYDPRRHRIHRGVRKAFAEWNGNGVKINEVGTKVIKL